MSKTRMSSAGAVLVVAMAFAMPAFAGGSGAADSAFGTLAGSQLSSGQLNKARGGTAVNIDNSFNSTRTTLNDTSSAGGTLDGNIYGSMSGWGIATNDITGSSGFINSVANTGNLVQVNQSMSVFINAQ